MSDDDHNPHEPPYAGWPGPPDDLGERKPNKWMTHGDGCFIATAAYNSPIAPKVMFLRRVRDNELKKTRGGSLFVQAYEWIYYKFSPRVALVMDRNPTFKAFMRIMIVEPIVKILQVIFKALPTIKLINKD